MKPRPPRSPATTAAAPGLSRRRLLGGALTAALTAALVPRDGAPRPLKTRWRETTRWIGHA